MAALMQAARAKGLKTIEGEVLSNNHSMLKLMTRLGFATKTSEEDQSIIKVVKDL
jgi:acetyltransferase